MSGIFRSNSKVVPVFGGTVEDPRSQQFLVDCLDVLETCGTSHCTLLSLGPNNFNTKLLSIAYFLFVILN